MSPYLLSLLVFSPLVAAVAVVALPQQWSRVYKYLALMALVFQLTLAVGIYRSYEIGPASPAGMVTEGDFQWTEKTSWFSIDLGGLGKLSADYFIGLDGLNITMVLLTVGVMLIALISSWHVNRHTKAYFALFLLLNTSILGCFVALDFLLFFLFFEFMLLPMYFLIGLWGGPRREYASIKFFLYTLLGSVFILLVMIGLHLSVMDPTATAIEIGLAEAGQVLSPQEVFKVQDLLAAGQIPPQQVVHTFNMVAMTDPGNYLPGAFLNWANEGMLLGVPFRAWAFLVLFLGFAIKVPVVPLHTWLPDAHVEAPTAISVVLAAILLKVGAYGFIRTGILIFPDGHVSYAWWVGLIGVVSILYGGMNALASKDLKKLIAYSSVSHMGFVLLGLASLTVEGVSGALYQMFSHGLISAMLFLIAGVIYDRTGDRMIGHYSGLASKMPTFTVVVVIAFFASLGLPGLSGFIAEILVLLGAFSSSGVNGLLPKWMAVAAAFGLLLAAGYYLWTIQRMFFGKLMLSRHEWFEKLTDLTPREKLMFIPLILVTLLLGIFPNFFLQFVNQSVGLLVHFVNGMTTPFID
jgi:NADH-quinone oxidoreductase subunit M